ncbi:class I SAM-dependent methyltransferase [Endozoicomonas atrinae]|uniref:class I SAM-dependent methyltransferase n=1 Tax=Endozoicomonas atrinae TaxID=1333660 RepID=UPI000824D390|nr:class I SAM-dependent methyltransferase [Endozoicomonas atrinae]
MVKPVSFADPEKCSEIFDSEHRVEWQNTPHVLSSLALSEDTLIADVGAGTGYFASQFARLAPRGKVYALDTESSMVSYMDQRFREEGLSNIETRLCEHTDPCLPESVDIVFLANVYRFIQDRPRFLSNLHQQIDDKAMVVFVDFRGDHARVKPAQALDEVRQAGFHIMNMDSSGCPDHYIMTFRKDACL